jgi:hypothetical protein
VSISLVEGMVTRRNIRVLVLVALWEVPMRSPSYATWMNVGKGSAACQTFLAKKIVVSGEETSSLLYARQEFKTQIARQEDAFADKRRK